MLRALHRKESEPPPNYAAAWPFRSFTRADAAPMRPGVPERMRFALLPVSWTFKSGSRIRFSLCGADADHFGQVPHGRPPVLTLMRGGAMPSAIELPWRDAR